MSKHFTEKQVVKPTGKEKELAKEKEVAKDHKDINDKGHKDIKDHKEQKDTKEHKDAKDHKDKESKNEKHEKEKHEKEFKDGKEVRKEYKEQNKEIEVQPTSPVDPSTLTASAQVEDAAAAEPYFKFEPDKFRKDFEKLFGDKIFEKAFKDKDKDIYEGGGYQYQGDPELARRVAALEATVGQLLHFIPSDLRPDLSTGALAEEPGAKKDEPAAPAAEPSSEKGKK